LRRPKLGDFVASVVFTSFRCLTLIPGTACSLALVPSLSAGPIELVNPSGEINPGLDRTLISETSVIGWQSNGGQVINDRTDFGNGGWRLSFEDSQEISQMTSQVIQSWDAFSLRFDASLFATGILCMPGIFFWRCRFCLHEANVWYFRPWTWANCGPLRAPFSYASRKALRCEAVKRARPRRSDFRSEQFSLIRSVISGYPMTNRAYDSIIVDRCSA
jgi:hypothetical protein